MDKTYYEFINEILNTRGRFNCGDEYHERHHIVPKSLGGTNDEGNLIDLFAREHYEAHRLLAQENPENNKLVYAWWMMSHCSIKKDGEPVRVKISAEEYEEARIAYSNAFKGANNPRYGKCLSEETKRKLSEAAKTRFAIKENNPFYGKHHTEESKRKLSESHIGKYDGERNPMYGITPKERMDDKTYAIWKQKVTDYNKSTESRQNRREKNLGKKYSDETNKKKGRSGQDHHMYGKHHTEETKQKLRDANTGKIQSEETRKKISDSLKGEKNPFYGRTHSEETRKKISEANKGRVGWNKGVPMSEEQKAKLSAAKKGVKLSEETRRKMSESRKGEKSNNATMVLQCDMDNRPIYVWSYIKIAATELNINRSCIGGCCKGLQKTAGGYKWYYVYDQIMRDGTIIHGAISLGYITEEDIQCLKF